MLIDRGVAPKLISEQLGHASIAITMDRYGHLFDQSYADASDAIEQAFELVPAAEEAVAAASGPPASTSTATPSPAASAPSGPVVPLEISLHAAGGGTA